MLANAALIFNFLKETLACNDALFTFELNTKTTDAHGVTLAF